MIATTRKREMRDREWKRECYFIKGRQRPLWGGEVCAKIWLRRQTLCPEQRECGRKCLDHGRKPVTEVQGASSEGERRRPRQRGTGQGMWHVVMLKCSLHKRFWSIMAKMSKPNQCMSIKTIIIIWLMRLKTSPAPAREWHMWILSPGSALLVGFKVWGVSCWIRFTMGSCSGVTNHECLPGFSTEGLPS